MAAILFLAAILFSDEFFSEGIVWTSIWNFGLLAWKLNELLILCFGGHLVLGKNIAEGHNELPCKILDFYLENWVIYDQSCILVAILFLVAVLFLVNFFDIFVEGQCQFTINLCITTNFSYKTNIGMACLPYVFAHVQLSIPL